MSDQLAKAVKRWMQAQYFVGYVGGAVVLAAIREPNWWVAGAALVATSVASGELQSRAGRSAERLQREERIGVDHHRAFTDI